MCGISGIINKCGSPVSPVDIQVMNDLIAHRGPDGCGLFADANLAFGHRRLAILDISAAGHQPMHYTDRYVVTFNGEIYNYLELKQELHLLGYQFTTKTDTEVILAAYDKWGADCVRRFNGMWGFALYDRRKKEIFCSRDRFGVKPFYYSDSADRFVFGSEIKQVLAGRNGPALVNMRMVRDFLVEGFHDHSNETFFDGIFNLRAGHNLMFSMKDNSFIESRYYSLQVDNGLGEMDEESVTARFTADFQRAINYQLRSDVAVGVCLSGGLDSSCIAGLAAKIYHSNASGKMQAIHAKTPEKRWDESAYARELAQSAGIDLSVIEPSATDFVDSIDEVAYCQEEPFAAPSIFMQYFVFKKAAQMGCKVMLDGQGCDEILLGYERYYSAHLRTMSLLRAARELFLLKQHCRLSLRALVAYVIYFSISSIRIINLRRKAWFLKPEYTQDFPNIVSSAKALRDIRVTQKMEIEAFQLPHLLRYADRNSMRHSIEARVPFLDHHLVETCYGMRSQFKIKNGWSKHVLRVAMKGLVSKSILWRETKFGFEAPESLWINEMRSAMTLAISESPLIQHMCRERTDFNKIGRNILWKLYSIAKWESVYKVELSANAERRDVETKLRPLEAVHPSVCVSKLAELPTNS